MRYYTQQKHFKGTRFFLQPPARCFSKKNTSCFVNRTEENELNAIRRSQSDRHGDDDSSESFAIPRGGWLVRPTPTLWDLIFLG